MTDRETAYHGHQTDAERLDDIRRRHEALRAHSAETDYAHRVIMDCAWLLAQVDAMRETNDALRRLAEGQNSYRNGYIDGVGDERKAVLEYLRGQKGAAGSSIIPRLAGGWATDIEISKHVRRAIARGDHLEGK
jgi:hypothetical protein